MEEASRNTPELLVGFFSIASFFFKEVFIPLLIVLALFRVVQLIGHFVISFFSFLISPFRDFWEQREKKVSLPIIERLIICEEEQRKIKKMLNELFFSLKGDINFQGQWGEQTFENILRMHGFVEDIDYKAQPIINQKKMFHSETLIPDFVLYLPNDTILIVDCKTPMKNYMNFIEVVEKSGSKSELESARRKYFRSIKNNLNTILEKNYIAIPKSLDVMLMYLPIDNMWSCLDGEQKEELLGYSDSVAIVTPSILLASIKMLSILSRKSKAKNSKK